MSLFLSLVVPRFRFHFLAISVCLPRIYSGPPSPCLLDQKPFWSQLVALTAFRHVITLDRTLCPSSGSAGKSSILVRVLGSDSRLRLFWLYFLVSTVISSFENIAIPMIRSFHRLYPGVHTARQPYPIAFFRHNYIADDASGPDLASIA